MIDWINCSGRGGQPGTYMSTGMNRSIPCTTQYVSNTPPDDAQAPIEMHHLGSGICSQMRWRTGIIFITTRPATSIRSHCRGLNRMASDPNRAMSYRLAAVDISSIPQQAVANGIRALPTGSIPDSYGISLTGVGLYGFSPSRWKSWEANRVPRTKTTTKPRNRKIG